MRDSCWLGILVVTTDFVGGSSLVLSAVLVGFGPTVGRCAWRSHRFCVTDLCCSEFVVAAVCGNCSLEAGEVRMLSLYYSWNWHGYYVFAVCSPYWGLTPRSLWGCCFCLPVCCSGFPGFAAGRGYDPAGGAPGGG
ncbi:hypothetical protein F511_37493 [Dorcoceras hygrometricum]|uniref:Uncharacterized protein n=1 Tax=Dorcoceras hygrometricum TaxID=472368 RepID=A0A2Z7AAT4_9LAMI|nr:hypothetical protein F511_37493 [Dorcoceras hygrometricum]